MEINWIQKTKVIGKGDKCPQWHRLPALAFTKTGLTLNTIAVRTFSFRAGDFLLVGTSQRKLLLKTPSTEEELDVAFLLGTVGSGKKHAAMEGPASLSLGTRRLFRLLQTIGLRLGDYEIVLMPQQHLMQVDMDKPLLLREPESNGQES